MYVRIISISGFEFDEGTVSLNYNNYHSNLHRAQKKDRYPKVPVMKNSDAHLSHLSLPQNVKVL